MGQHQGQGKFIMLLGITQHAIRGRNPKAGPMDFFNRLILTNLKQSDVSFWTTGFNNLILFLYWIVLIPYENFFTLCLAIIGREATERLKCDALHKTFFGRQRRFFFLVKGFNPR